MLSGCRASTSWHPSPWQLLSKISDSLFLGKLIAQCQYGQYEGSNQCVRAKAARRRWRQTTRRFERQTASHTLSCPVLTGVHGNHYCVGRMESAAASASVCPRQRSQSCTGRYQRRVEQHTLARRASGRGVTYASRCSFTFDTRLCKCAEHLGVGCSHMLPPLLAGQKAVFA